MLGWTDVIPYLIWSTLSHRTFSRALPLISVLNSSIKQSISLSISQSVGCKLRLDKGDIWHTNPCVPNLRSGKSPNRLVHDSDNIGTQLQVWCSVLIYNVCSQTNLSASLILQSSSTRFTNTVHGGLTVSVWSTIISLSCTTARKPSLKTVYRPLWHDNGPLKRLAILTWVYWTSSK